MNDKVSTLDNYRPDVRVKSPTSIFKTMPASKEVSPTASQSFAMTQIYNFSKPTSPVHKSKVLRIPSSSIKLGRSAINSPTLAYKNLDTNQRNSIIDDLKISN